MKPPVPPKVPETDVWDSLTTEAREYFAREWQGIPAYSEFMPPPWVGFKPFGFPDPFMNLENNQNSWPVQEYEELLEIRPGLRIMAEKLFSRFEKLRAGLELPFSKTLLKGNPAFPPCLHGALPRVSSGPTRLLLPLALSKTQDDKGRVRWTLFGLSHGGPAEAFWRSFSEGARHDGEIQERLRRVLAWFFPATGFSSLVADGVRILPVLPDPDFPQWREDIPGRFSELIVSPHAEIKDIRYLITFRPFAHFPERFQEAYLAGRFALLPSPETLIFWWHQGYRRLARHLPEAAQIPLLHLFPRGSADNPVRILPSGWLDEKPDSGLIEKEGHLRLGKVRRSHRFDKVDRETTDQPAPEFEDHVTTVLFSNRPDDLGLYGKPMARNCQIWDEQYNLVLNGPRARPEEFQAALERCTAGGRFGYRFYYLPMQMGPRRVFWHRPLIARSGGLPGEMLLENLLPGFFSAERVEAAPIALAPDFVRQDLIVESLSGFDVKGLDRRSHPWMNLKKVHYWSSLLNGHLPLSFARDAMNMPKEDTLARWFEDLARREQSPGLLKKVQAFLQTATVATAAAKPEPPITYASSRTRAFEENFWNFISRLSDGSFADANNADPVPVNRGKTGGPLGQSLNRLPAGESHLDKVVQFLKNYYQNLFIKHDLAGKAFTADHEFKWETEFAYPWMEGWKLNQEGKRREKNLFVVIPGRNRSEAVIMADHYDTAYMEDLYDPKRKGDRIRAAEAGADDNHSATASLMLAADILLPLSRQGLLERDVWLVHLTGEEFPADCLGARALCAAILRRSLPLKTADGATLDLGQTLVKGAFVLDMIAHNNDKDKYVFQISPGEGPQAAQIALLAHAATRRWNEGTKTWNAQPERKNAYQGRTGQLPATARYPQMSGEIRSEWDSKSSLFNTDGQIFSDLGIPVVLFMENYDLNRKGYHDTEDTMKNIDLDYGAAVAAIAIESVALAATAP